MKLTNTYPSLANKRILVTGGANGIGEVIVRAFAEQNAIVSIIDVDIEAANALKAELKANHIYCFKCDVSQHAQLQQTVINAHQAMGGLDVLINNAANDVRHAWDVVTPEFWANNLALNCGSQFFAMQAAAKLMMANDVANVVATDVANPSNENTSSKGSIINLGSVSWMRRRAGMVGYTSSKAAIHGMTRTMAQELGPLGIRVNCVVPGAIKTPKQDRLVVTPELEKQFFDNQALKFRLVSEDVAAMALFLASDDARACAGQSFVVDGGIS
jgi:D-xylose 1-dehydrogenase